MLDINDLVAGYRPTVDIIKGATLSIEKNEIACLIGANGAGKSTLFKAIAGDLTPRKGTVSLDGEDVTGDEPFELLKTGLLHIPQGQNIFPQMTVRENLEMGGYLLSNDARDRRLEEILDQYPLLVNKLSQKSRTLSGGERQILEMARGLMMDPTYVLVDEPSAGLDPQNRSEVFERIRDLRTPDRGVLIIEQNLKQGMEIADRGLTLERGVITKQKSADGILADEEIQQTFFGTG